MNRSKRHDSRAWAKWRVSGAVEGMIEAAERGAALVIRLGMFSAVELDDATRLALRRYTYESVGTSVVAIPHRNVVRMERTRNGADWTLDVGGAPLCLRFLVAA